MNWQRRCVCVCVCVCVYVMGFPGGTSGKEPACQCRRHNTPRFNPWVGKIPWRRAQQPTPVFLPGEFHGQRSLMGYSPQGCKESDTMERTQHTHTLQAAQRPTTQEDAVSWEGRDQRGIPVRGLAIGLPKARSASC